MTPEEDEGQREVREALERRDPRSDEEEAAKLKTLGQAITVIREWRGMTREELAPKCGITVPELERIESGKVDERWGDLRRVAQGLGIPLPALFRKFEELDAGPSSGRWRPSLAEAESDGPEPDTPSDAAEGGERE